VNHPAAPRQPHRNARPNRSRRHPACALLLALLVCVAPAAGQTPADDGLLSVDGTSYSLWGIEIPPRAQTCGRGWPAGEEAARALAQLTDGKALACEPRGKDRSGHPAAVCRADGVDVGAEMVRAGLAWARLGIAKGYVLDEARAAALYLGVHGHRCLQPDVWRTKNEDQQFERREGGVAR
jgi:endonuclease YncB( thermonuclease family)